MKKELDYFELVLEKPKRPLIVVIGGAKIRDKIQLISNIVDLADEIIIGGGMSYTFRNVAFGMPYGDSLFDKEGAKIVPGILQKIKDQGKKLHLPIDYWVADKFDNEANKKVIDANKGIPDGWMGLDTGPESLKLFHNVIKIFKPFRFFKMQRQSFGMAPSERLKCQTFAMVQSPLGRALSMQLKREQSLSQVEETHSIY